MRADTYVEMYEEETEHWWFCARRDILAHLLTSLCSSDKTTIIEVGCGTGGNLEMLSAHGRVSAIELDASARALASKRGVAQILAGSLPDDLPAVQPADLVCLLDVLEHIEDDLAALKGLRPLLNDGGQLLLTVPAFMVLWSTHDEALHHHRRYTLAELSSLLDQAGFAISYSSYFNSLLFPLIAGVRVLHRALGGGVQTDVSRPHRLVNALLYRVFRAERHLLPRLRLPIGVSIVVVATLKVGER